MLPATVALLLALPPVTLALPAPLLALLQPLPLPERVLLPLALVLRLLL
jgi:hypothetical protein